MLITVGLEYDCGTWPKKHRHFTSNLSGAWHFVGLASRLAVELGLHDERVVDARLGQEDVNQRRWLFWACYTLERNLCVVV